MAVRNDIAHMDAALGLAARGLGNAWPNPAVGCVLVRNDVRDDVGAGGRVVGRGWTQPGGRPHAETQALARAAEAARGATAYVTLEPCSHHGRTPPCSDALIGAGIARCVVACTDTNPQVAGQGIEKLRAAGIAVTTGVREAEARHLNAGFFKVMEEGRPLVTLKIATTLDGHIATRSGESKWITGPQARARTHLERARHDAVLVGSGTVAADDPDLTCRLPGVDPRPVVRVVLASDLFLDPGRALIRTARQAPTWVYCRQRRSADSPAIEAFQAHGVEVIATDGDPDAGLDVTAVVRDLARRGITRLMVEGGSRVAAAFLAAGLVDRVLWFRAAKVIGADGLAAVAELGLDRLADCPDFARLAVEPVGSDMVEVYERR